jgi:hypothetical protein
MPAVRPSQKDDGSPTKFLLQALNIRNGQVMFQDQAGW